MSLQKAYKMVLDQLGAGADVAMVAIILTLPRRFALADVIDPLGRSIVLPGLSGLGEGDYAEEARHYIREQLAAGVCPDFVHPLTFGLKASEAFPAVLEGPHDEFMLNGGRGSGKTIVKYALALTVAEHHYRAGYTTVYRFMDLHDSLLSASVKTGRSLELPLWRGIWSLHDDRREARCTLAGREFMRVDFVGCADDSSAQRLRSSANGGGGEELIDTFTDGGIPEEKYLLGRSSTLREPTWRRVFISTTNPGAPETWPARRFGIQGPGQPNALAIQIPCEDRMTSEEQDALNRTFAGKPTLQRRLAKGEWVMAELGASVAEGFDERAHVSPYPLTPRQDLVLVVGLDGGHQPSGVICQLVNGTVCVYAALNLPGAGMLQFCQQVLRPWLEEFCAWSLADYGANLICAIDPNLRTGSQTDILETGEKIIVEQLGARCVPGAIRWSPRRESLLRVLRPGHEHGRPPLLIAPGPDTALLVQALAGRWFYTTLPNGQVDRTGPKKPNSPWSDLGDALCYACGFLLGGESMDIAPREVKVIADFQIERLGAPSVISNW